MPTYEEIKSELLEISKIVEAFPEAMKTQVFELLVQRFLGTESAAPTKQKLETELHKDDTQTEEGAKSKQKQAKTRKLKESYSIDRDLNLRGDESVPSFTQFCDEKKPRSAMEFNAVAIYYLKKMMGLIDVTLDQVYTCYDEAKMKPPQCFKQSFIDTKNQKGWIEFNNEGKLDIPHRGSVFVEHDLPKASRTSKTK